MNYLMKKLFKNSEMEKQSQAKELLKLKTATEEGTPLLFLMEGTW